MKFIGVLTTVGVLRSGLPYKSAVVARESQPSARWTSTFTDLYHVEVEYPSRSLGAYDGPDPDKGVG
jgi:hypothetical protein